MSETSLAGLTRDELRAFVSELDEPSYRADQIGEWVHRRGAKRYADMTNLPKALRARLEERLPVRASEIARREPSDDGTVKLLLTLSDGEQVECVLIPEGDRRTACLSSQVGCGVGCVFCASGAEGVVRNLTAGEIVEQCLFLTDEAGERLTNIVVMGMGEPLHNLEALAKALGILQDPEGLDLGSRRITISTAGPTKGFEQLMALKLKVKLALSLHAPTDAVRRELVPRGGTGRVEELKRMAERWFAATRRDVTFEYVLLDGINDHDEDMRALARLAGRHVNVNLIPMNPVRFAPQLKAPPPDRVGRCVEILEKAGVVVHSRRQRGDDVAAACGQLRLHQQGERSD